MVEEPKLGDAEHEAASLVVTQPEEAADKNYDAER